MDQGSRNQVPDYQIEEKVDPNLHHVGLGPDFLNNTPTAQEIKARINKWDRFKLKSFFSAQETIM